ncbi:hypothetical protein BJ165DRAFT_157832 [Panaeolus papilionaceus]|nr:hypothetical protein BJ165DRAFT_157832 [Panaeolus papilionaceus]
MVKISIHVALALRCWNPPCIRRSVKSSCRQVEACMSLEEANPFHSFSQNLWFQTRSVSNWYRRRCKVVEIAYWLPAAIHKPGEVYLTKFLGKFGGERFLGRWEGFQLFSGAEPRAGKYGHVNLCHECDVNRGTLALRTRVRSRHRRFKR